MSFHEVTPSLFVNSQVSSPIILKLNLLYWPNRFYGIALVQSQIDFTTSNFSVSKDLTVVFNRSEVNLTVNLIWSVANAKKKRSSSCNLSYHDYKLFNFVQIIFLNIFIFRINRLVCFKKSFIRNAKNSRPVRKPKSNTSFQPGFFTAHNSVCTKVDRTFESGSRSRFRDYRDSCNDFESRQFTQIHSSGSRPTRSSFCETDRKTGQSKTRRRYIKEVQIKILC